MSTTAVATAPRVNAKPITDRDGMREKHAHAGVAMAVATLAMGAASGIQALLYLSSFGAGAKTDGFLSPSPSTPASGSSARASGLPRRQCWSVSDRS
jgi:hypothetical protein